MLERAGQSNVRDSRRWKGLYTKDPSWLSFVLARVRRGGVVARVLCGAA